MWKVDLESLRDCVFEGTPRRRIDSWHAGVMNGGFRRGFVDVALQGLLSTKFQ